MKFKKISTLLTVAAVTCCQLMTAMPAYASQISFTNELERYMQWQPGDTVDTEVVNFLAVEQLYYPRGIILSWSNPDDADLDNIAIFKNGVQIEEDNEWNYEAGAFNRIGVDKGDPEDIYTLEIEKNGRIYEYEAVYGPVSSSKGNWSFSINDGWSSDTIATNRYSNSVAFINSDYGYDDDYCLTLMSNSFQQTFVDTEDRNHNENISNNRTLKAQFNFPMELTIEDGAIYQVRYMVKTKSAYGLYLYAKDRSDGGWAGSKGNQNIERNSDWTQKITTFVHNGTNNGLEFSIPRACDGIWIDNFQIGIYDEDTDVFNVLYEEDFTPEKVEIEPKNFFGSYGKENVWAVSWQNPDAEILESIELYEVKEDREVFVSDSFNLSAGTMQSYEFPDATGVKLVKGVFRYTTGEVVEMFATNETYSLWGNTIPHWNFGLNTQQAIKHVPGMFMVDQSMSHTDDGTASVKIAVNQPSSSPGTFASSHFHNNVDLEGGKRYRISFWLRSIGTINDLKFSASGGFEDGSTFLSSSSGQYEWKQFVKYYAPAEKINASFAANFDTGTTGIWVDDFEIYEVDENGEPIGENLAVNGDVSIYDEPTGTPGQFKAVGGDRSITLTWENDSGYDFVYLYRVEDDEYKFLGAIPAARNSVTLTNLKRETEYTYAIAPAVYFGVTGSKIEASAETLLLDVEMSKPKLSGDELVVGENTISMTVKNNTISDGIPVEMLVGIYKDGILQQVKSDRIFLEMTDADEDSEELEVRFTIGEGDYGVRVMVLDDRTTLNSYFDMLTY